MAKDSPSFFPVESGVRHGCVIAPSMFSVFMDWLMGRIVGSGVKRAMFVQKRFTDLDFADDAVINFVGNVKNLVDSLAALSQESETASLLDEH